ncbi:proline racemase family protein [Microlunatus soli]|uniref:Proline racemase n=1 Tax=Microlunatus soli TaxID=630515 RepID=A0A1H1VDC7_9ACTN|nr:proline racemase family protein [Microlunatus soli]SDS82406.1 Proline racemase [Microlunatus soli]
MPILDVVDAEAGGDVGRVVVAGFDPPPGRSVADQARYLRDEADGLRRALIAAPYGEPSQSINLVVPALTPEADVGLIITGTMGYPGFSGSNAMCTVAALIDRGIIDPADGVLRLETPAGITPVDVHVAGAALSVSYPAPVAYAEPGQRIAEVPGWGRVAYTLAYSGTCYVVVDSADVGLRPTAAAVPEIRRLFDALLDTIGPEVRLDHPDLGVLAELRLGLLADSTVAVDPTTPETPCPVAVYMAGGVICEGPTGTGTSALLAWLAGLGRIGPGTRLLTTAPSGNSFTGEYTDDTMVGPYPAARTRVTGRPRLLGRTTIDLRTDG